MTELTLNTFSTLAIPFPKMVPSWSPIPASKKPNSGIPKMAYKMQKILPPTVLGAMFPYPVEKKNYQKLRTYTHLFRKTNALFLQRCLCSKSNSYLPFSHGMMSLPRQATH